MQAIHDHRWVGEAVQTQTQQFDYDDLDRLTNASTWGAGTWGSYSESYTYDSIGNLTSKGGVTYTYPASGADSERPHAVTSTSGGDTFQYDANGNMTSRTENGVTYAQTWDSENRLTQVAYQGKTTTFTYDGDGALVKKDDGVGVTTYVGTRYERYEIPASRDWASDDFDDGNADGWTPDGGTWAVESGAYSGSHTGSAVSLWNRTFQTGKLWARVQTQSWSGHWRNGFLVFDYLDGDNYKYAGLEDGSNRWVIKEAVDGSHYLREELAETIQTGQWYDLEVVVSGDTATLEVGGVQKVSHTFASGIQGGQVGLRVDNAHTHFDDVSASSHRIDDFRDGDAAGWSPSAGSWSVEGADWDTYSGEHTAEALSVWNQTMTGGRLGADVSTQSWGGHWYNGFLVFDYQDGDNYKYAGMLDGSNQWVIKEAIGGTHYTRAEAGETIQTGQPYALEVEVSGDTATLRVGGQTKVSHTFASGIRGGQVGLRVDNAHTHFQEVALRRLVNVTQYYTLGGQRVALRRDGGLTYLLADHLGSTALTVDRNGAKVAELRYKAYGETRYESGTTPTDYRYTGQREDGYIKLYHMGARWYDVSLARWLSADTIVPDPGNPQALNRYSYVGGNPLRFTDPTGHARYGGDDYDPADVPWVPRPPFDVTALELFWLWLLEQLPDETRMDERYGLTQQLTQHKGVNQAREEFYQRMLAGTLDNGTELTYSYRFFLKEYVQELPALMTGQTIGSFLGSYVVQVHLNDNDTVTFTVTDPKDLSSATKNPLYFAAGYLGDELSEHSWEGVLTGKQHFSWPVDLFMQSFLEPRRRGSPGPLGRNVWVGGTVMLMFTWTEPLRVNRSQE